MHDRTCIPMWYRTASAFWSKAWSTWCATFCSRLPTTAPRISTMNWNRSSPATIWKALEQSNWKRVAILKKDAVRFVEDMRIWKPAPGIDFNHRKVKLYMPTPCQRLRLTCYGQSEQHKHRLGSGNGNLGRHCCAHG